MNLSPDEIRAVLMQALYAVAAGAGALVTGLPQKGWKRFQAWRTDRRANKANIGTVLTQMKAMAEALAGINYQINPNGGGSLRDSVDRTEAATKAVANTLEGQNTELAALRRDTALVTAIVRFQSDIATDATFQCDPTGRNSYVSLSYQRLLGVSERDLRDFGWRNYVAPDEAASYIADADACMRDRRKFQRRVHLVRGDGQRILVDVTMVPYPDDLSQPLQSLFGQIKLVAA